MQQIGFGLNVGETLFNLRHFYKPFNSQRSRASRQTPPPSLTQRQLLQGGKNIYYNGLFGYISLFIDMPKSKSRVFSQKNLS